jgi:hypothetical protein
VDIVRDVDRANVIFTGILLSATNVDGSWEIVTNAVSPHSVDLSGAQKYYLAAPPLTNSIFASRSVATLNLTGPLQAYFELAYAGVPDGIFPPIREKPYFDGAVTVPGLTLPVSMRVRGNSSLQECPFPKIKFKMSKEVRQGTPFADAREIKVGTHCAEGGRGGIGRLREQIATFREALAYETMELMEFVTPQVRRAHLRYRDTTPPTNSASIVGWDLLRQAFILEDIEVVALRLNGRALTDSEIESLPASPFDMQLSTDLQFLHALLGNWDYALAWDSRGVWNTDVLELPAGSGTQLIPVAGDFDLASWVTGIVRGSAPHDYHPELGDVEREALYKLEEIQKRVSPANFLAARQRFTAKRTAVESLVASANIDDEGRANALRHVVAFYTALEAVR